MPTDAATWTARLRRKWARSIGKRRATQNASGVASAQKYHHGMFPTNASGQVPGAPRNSCAT